MVVRFLLLLFVGISTQSYAADFKPERRIYLLDVTKSMWGFNDSTPDIYSDVVNSLQNGIESITDPNTEIVVIPFQGTDSDRKQFPIWTFKRSEYHANEKEFINKLKSYTIDNVLLTGTDICGVLKFAKSSYCKTNRTNYVYLLTDGVQSSKELRSVDNSVDDLLRELNDWCSWAKKHDTFLFYVMLTKHANNSEIVNTIEKNCNEYVVPGTDCNITFLKPVENKIYLNVLETCKVSIALEANNWSFVNSLLNVSCEVIGRGNISIKDVDFNIEGRHLVLTIAGTQVDLISSLPQKSEIKLKLTSNDKTIILKPIISLVVLNKKEKVLKIGFVDE